MGVTGFKDLSDPIHRKSVQWLESSRCIRIGPIVPLRLKAGNGEIIAVSEAYNSKSSALGGVESVRKNAPDAKLEDQTS